LLLFIAKQKNEPVKHPVEMFNGVTLGFLASLPLEQLGLPPVQLAGTREGLCRRWPVPWASPQPDALEGAR